MDFPWSDTGNMLLNRDVQGKRKIPRSENRLILKSYFYRRARRKRATGKDNHGLNNIGEKVLESAELTFS